MATLLNACLSRLVRDGAISQQAADAAEAMHEGLQGRLNGEFGPTHADAAAALEAARAMMARATQKKLAAANAAIAIAKAEERMMAHPNGESAGLVAMLAPDPWGRSGGVNLESHSEVVLASLMKHVGEALRPYESRLAGFKQDVAGTRNMVRELYGVDTKDPTAKAAAAAWSEGVAQAFARHKRTGASTEFLEDWRLPQSWDRTRIAPGDPKSRSSIHARARFKEEILDAANAGRLTIMDKRTGQPAVRGLWDTIVDTAIEDIQRGALGGTAGKGFNREMRVFRMNDADTWLELMDRWGVGRGGVFEMLQGHLRGMAREIAIKEIFSPAYEAVFKRLHERAIDAKNVRGAAGGRLARVLTGPRVAELAWKDLTGELGTPQSETLAGIFGGLRNWKTATSLGSAIVSAIPGDAVTTMWAARASGMSGVRVMKRAIDIIRKDTEGGRAQAARLNIIAHGVMDAAIATKRWEDMIVGTNLPGRLAAAVIRASGLQRWTESLKRAFAMEFNAMVADQARLPWARLDRNFRTTLERHGISVAEWNAGRKTPLIGDDEGGTWFDMDAAGELGRKLNTAMIDERHFAVIEPTAVTRAITTMGTKRGTVAGEIARSSFMFKSFAITVMLTHVMRALSEGTFGQRAWRMAAFLVTMTLGGAVALQAKQLIAGKDPRAMDTGDFWWAALGQGGGLGIYGDLIYSASTRSGQGLVSTLAGPVLSAPGQAVDLIQKLIGPTTGKTKGEAIFDFVQQWTPGSTLWFSRLATDRYVFDFLQRMVDPQADVSGRRIERDLRQDYGQGFWWAPMTSAPQRAPNLGAVASPR